MTAILILSHCVLYHCINSNRYYNIGYKLKLCISIMKIVRHRYQTLTIGDTIKYLRYELADESRALLEFFTRDMTVKKQMLSGKVPTVKHRITTLTVSPEISRDWWKTILVMHAFVGECQRARMVASVASENSSSSFLNIISDRYCRVRCRILEARSANSLEEHSQAEALRFARKMVMYGISLHYIVLCLLMLLLNFY